MTQVCEKIAIEKEGKETEQKAAQKANEKEVDNALGGLNPRYFEQVMTLKEAKEKIISRYHVESKMNWYSPL